MNKRELAHRVAMQTNLGFANVVSVNEIMFDTVHETLKSPKV